MESVFSISPLGSLYCLQEALLEKFFRDVFPKLPTQQFFRTSLKNVRSNSLEAFSFQQQSCYCGAFPGKLPTISKHLWKHFSRSLFLLTSEILDCTPIALEKTGQIFGIFELLELPFIMTTAMLTQWHFLHEERMSLKRNNPMNHTVTNFIFFFSKKSPFMLVIY